MFKDKEKQRIARQERLDFINSLPNPPIRRLSVCQSSTAGEALMADSGRKPVMTPYVYRPRAGYIYIIHCVGFPYYKIGQAKQPKLRVDGLQTGVPFELTLEYAGAVEDMNEVERKIQKQYKDKCIRGEWFMFTDQELETVKTDIVALKDYVYGQDKTLVRLC